MKKSLTLVILFFVVFTAVAQRKRIDSLKLAIRKTVTDTDKFNALNDLSALYNQSYPDSAILFNQQAFLLAKKNNWAKGQAGELVNMADGYLATGDCATALQYYFKGLRIEERFHFQVFIIIANYSIGCAYSQNEDHSKGLTYALLALKQLQDYTRNHQLEARYKTLKTDILGLIGVAYLSQPKLDSAGFYLDAAYKSARELTYQNSFGVLQVNLGQLEALKNNTKGALQYYRQAVASCKTIYDDQTLSGTYLDIAELYHKNKLPDSALYYGRKALDAATRGNFKQQALNAGKDLYQYYDEVHDLPQAFKYFKLTATLKDSLYSQDKVKQLLTIDFNEKQRQLELQTTQREAQKEAQNKLRMYVLSAGLGVLLLLAIIFWRNSNHRKKANRLLSKQKKEIEDQRDQTNKALTELQQTQTQLVQREKMASLGELTAGIAHEIQNPLNFVNNFSEVNEEMLTELKEALTTGNTEEALAIANDVEENEKKIRHHGKRADFIVKGMLEHSRTSTGERQATNINVLADEFLKLSYHGLRAKDKNFNAGLVTNFDTSVPRINIVQQDIGRVLINLFNNAFYAVNQKAKTAGSNYKPEVSVTTSNANGQVIICVKDNGVGIPDAIKEKIMQPFFTTKPTGEGTGLGLSLSYDIVVKGHGGSINVNTKEGEYTEFMIVLPIS